MRILVTGAAGFIGSSVSEALLARGDEVVGLDNFDPFYERRLKERNLCGLLQSKHFVFHEADLLDGAALDRLLSSGLEGVIHLAALAGVRPSLATPQRYLRVNVEGTSNLLEACRRHAVSRLAVASSSSVYGARSRVPFSEEDPCDVPASPYAASKKCTEVVCANYNQLYGMGISCLRFFTVYGPRQRPEMAIHAFVRLALAGKPVPIFGDGSSGRDYTFISDIVQGTIAALDRSSSGFRLYNLGNSRPVLLRELIEAIGQAIGRPIATEERPLQAGDVPITCADIRRASEELGYQPRVSLSEGLSLFVDWYRREMA